MARMQSEERTQRTLERLRAQLHRVKPRHYFALMMGLIIGFQFFDMMCSGVYSNLQEAVVRDFAGLEPTADITVGAAGYEPYQATLSQMTLISLVTYAFMGITPWYKSLADRYGRKPFFVLNAVGLAIAMLVGGFTHNLVVFMAVLAFISFFTLHDMQIIYVMECVPERRRGTWMAVVQAVGNAGGLVVIALRFGAIQPDGTIGAVPWRPIFIVIAVFGVIVAIISALLLKESDPWLTARVAYLEKPAAEREREARDPAHAQGGVIKALRLMFTNKQLRWLAIATLLFSTANNMVCSYNNSIMSQYGLNAVDITLALIVASAIAVLVGLAMGPVSDRFGRKNAAICFGVVSALTMAAFVFVTPQLGDATMMAIFSGLMVGVSMNSYTNMNTLTALMMSESSPSAMRSSIIGARSFFMVTAVVAMALSGVLFSYFPTGVVCFGLSVPFLALGCVALMKTRETAGRSIEEIEAEFAE